MKKLKLILFTCLPLFGVLSMMGVVVEHPYHQLQTTALYINMVPVMIWAFVAVLVDGHGRWLSVSGILDILGPIIIAMINLAFWIPVAHCTNKLWEHYKGKRQKGPEGVTLGV